MTDNDIIKALELCISGKDYYTACFNCPIESTCESDDNALKYALDLINRQKKEIKRLQKSYLAFEETSGLKKAKSEAIKEFAERLKEKKKNTAMDSRICTMEMIDDLVKEMTEEI